MSAIAPEAGIERQAFAVRKVPTADESDILTLSDWSYLHVRSR
jgi:hypothetical protein